MNRKNWLALIGFIFLSQAAGIVGSFFTATSLAGWYKTLVRPELAPPDWVFGPVWATLFFLMGVAAYLVWRKRGTHDVKFPLVIFVIQLVLNTLWSILFFGLQSPGGAFVEIMFLWLGIAMTIWKFARISGTAAWLLVPYISWVSFAVYLNFMFWRLNS